MFQIRFYVYWVSLTLCFMNFILRRFLRYNLRKALFVYRLIVAMLIGNFFDDPFLFQNWNLGQNVLCRWRYEAKG